MASTFISSKSLEEYQLLSQVFLDPHMYRQPVTFPHPFLLYLPPLLVTMLHLIYTSIVCLPQ